MSAKRPHPSSSQAVHPSRREQVPAEASRKRRKTNPHPERQLQPKAHPINKLKSRIRNLQRLLSHVDGNDDEGKKGLPADVRIGHERELASCKWELKRAEEEARRKEMIGKWHMVRFFDRQKATRRLKAAKRHVREVAGGEAKEEAAKLLHDAEVDLNYAMYHPLDMPYSALYPSGKKRKRAEGSGNDEDLVDETEDGDAGSQKQETRKGDTTMWKLVEQCMSEGKLDALRKGKLTKAPDQDQNVGPDQRTKLRLPANTRAGNVAQGKNRKRHERSGKAATEDMDGEEVDSDGGFFES